jgi:hypothetical protein
MVTNSDNFQTILIVAGLSLVIFYLLSTSNAKFTNNKTEKNNSLPSKVRSQNVIRNVPKNVKKLRENIANVDDFDLDPNAPVSDDLPVNPGTVGEPPSTIPESVVASAELNKQFPTGSFKPLLLTPSNSVTPNALDMSSADVGNNYTLGVDQNAANPSGRQMQTSDDLRPQQMNSGWFNSPYDRDSQLNIENGNLLASATAQAKIGIDTIGQSLRNASYDIRGSVAIPKFDIGPFNNSTIEYDYNIKSLY